MRYITLWVAIIIILHTQSCCVIIPPFLLWLLGRASAWCRTWALGTTLYYYSGKAGSWGRPWLKRLQAQILVAVASTPLG